MPSREPDESDPVGKTVVVKPDPDPTELTNRLVRTAVATERELTDEKVGAIEKQISSRVDNGQVVVQFLEMLAERVEGEIRLRVDAARDVLKAEYDEKFRGINDKFAGVQQQFGDVKSQTATTLAAADKAVSVAFTAQKEAVIEGTKAGNAAAEKAEKSMLETNKQEREIRQADMRTTNSNVSSLNDRVTRIESVKSGEAEHKTGQQSSVSAVVGVIGAVIGAISAVVAILMFVMFIMQMKSGK